MIETREYFIGKIGLKLCIDVLLGIHIDETNATTAVIVVRIEVMYSNDVGANFQRGDGKVDKTFGEVQVDLMAVLIDFGDLLAFEIEDKFRWYGQQIE